MRRRGQASTPQACCLQDYSQQVECSLAPAVGTPGTTVVKSPVQKASEGEDWEETEVVGGRQTAPFVVLLQAVSGKAQQPLDQMC